MSLGAVAVWFYEAVLWPRPWHGNANPRLKASMRRAWSIGRVQTGYITSIKLLPNLTQKLFVPFGFHFVALASLVFMAPFETLIGCEDLQS